MMTLRRAVPALLIAASLAGAAVYAETTATPTAPAGGHWRHGHGHGFGMGGMGFVLHKLDLTAAQKAQIKTLFSDQQSQFQSLHASMKANREALATTPPTDPSYATLLETAKSNAAARITLESELWSNVYQHVLTKTQQDAIPGLVAAAQASRQAHMAAWRAQQPQAAD